MPRVSDAPAFTNKRIKDAAQIKFFAQSPMFEGLSTIYSKPKHLKFALKLRRSWPRWVSPRQRSVLVIMEDLIQGKNPITGGEGDIGGDAWKMKHGIRIPLQHLGVYILLHEHAHMTWFNMSKPGKWSLQGLVFFNRARQVLRVQRVLQSFSG